VFLRTFARRGEAFFWKKKPVAGREAARQVFLNLAAKIFVGRKAMDLLRCVKRIWPNTLPFGPASHRRFHLFESNDTTRFT
jgi:hypothetical protein